MQEEKLKNKKAKKNKEKEIQT